MKTDHEKQIGLAKQAYSGAPKPLTGSVPFCIDALERRQVERHWSYKGKRQRRAELFATL